MTPSKLKWKCISNCGACCRLSPEERTEAIKILSKTQLKKYLEMVGSDGWCRHFDKVTKKCTIYENRPDFCKVNLIGRLYELEPEQINNFCISCCKLQIRSIYGGKSIVMKRFVRSIKEN